MTVVIAGAYIDMIMDPRLRGDDGFRKRLWYIKKPQPLPVVPELFCRVGNAHPTFMYLPMTIFFLA